MLDGRSCSKIERADDINHSITNNWLKKEMYIDFNQDDYEIVEDYINVIIYDHNYLRASYALNYKTPIEYRTQLGFK